MLVPSEVHVGVIGRGAIGPRCIQDKFQLTNPWPNSCHILILGVFTVSFLLNISSGEVYKVLNIIPLRIRVRIGPQHPLSVVKGD
jgi:hypothetical protein